MHDDDRYSTNEMGQSYGLAKTTIIRTQIHTDSARLHHKKPRTGRWLVTDNIDQSWNSFVFLGEVSIF